MSARNEKEISAARLELERSIESGFELVVEEFKKQKGAAAAAAWEASVRQLASLGGFFGHAVIACCSLYAMGTRSSELLDAWVKTMEGTVEKIRAVAGKIGRQAAGQTPGAEIDEIQSAIDSLIERLGDEA